VSFLFSFLVCVGSFCFLSFVFCISFCMGPLSFDSWLPCSCSILRFLFPFCVCVFLFVSDVSCSCSRLLGGRPLSGRGGRVGAPTFLLLLFCSLSRYDVYRRSILHVYIRAHSGLANLTVLLRSLAPLGMTIYITVLLRSLAPLGPTASYRPTV